MMGTFGRIIEGIFDFFWAVGHAIKVAYIQGFHRLIILASLYLTIETWLYFGSIPTNLGMVIHPLGFPQILFWIMIIPVIFLVLGFFRRVNEIPVLSNTGITFFLGLALLFGAWYSWNHGIQSFLPQPGEYGFKWTFVIFGIIVIWMMSIFALLGDNGPVEIIGAGWHGKWKRSRGSKLIKYKGEPSKELDEKGYRMPEYVAFNSQLVTKTPMPKTDTENTLRL